MAGFGFIFWRVNTNFYSPAQIGIATAIISSVQLLTNISMLGLPQAVVKIIPNAKRVHNLVGEIMLLTFITSVFAGIIYIFVAPAIAPEIANLLKNPAYTCVFLVLTGVTGVNTLTDSVLIAKRRADFVLYEYLAAGISKLVMAISLTSFGSMGIFFASNGSFIVALTITLVGFRLLQLHPRPTKSFINVREIKGLATKNYIAALLGGSSTLLLPLIIMNILTPSDAAYYYMVFMIAGLINFIPTATSNSLYAELAHNTNGNTLKSVIHTTKITMLIVSPVVAVIVLFSEQILHIFGGQYSSAGSILLKFYAASALFIAVKNICGSYLRVYSNMRGFIAIEFATATLTLILSMVCMHLWGLTGMGIAWLATHVITTAAFALTTRSVYRK